VIDQRLRDNVRWVYLAVSGMGILVAVAFLLIRLPEVSEESLQAEADALVYSSGNNSPTDKPPYKQCRAISGFVAQVSRPSALLNSAC
jgi:FHS family L-fucose permease-like MFS transporter